MMKLSAKFIQNAGICLIIIIGAVHLWDASDSFKDAIYKGWLFVVNGVFSLVVALGILLANKKWAWVLGFLIALGSMMAYVASRTIGLPLLAPEPDAWFEPLGVVAVLSELLFIVLFYMNSKVESK
jgi:uncharacterized membrane protein YagU involved in acid resistance